MSTPTPEQDREQVRRILEQELAQVDSPEAAEAIVKRIEALAAGKTQLGEAAQAANAPGTAANDIARAAQTAEPTEEAAAVLTTAAAQAVAPTPEAPAVTRAVRDVLGAGPTPAPDARAERGRAYLREATLRRLGLVERIDARLYLLINELPHPRWLNTLVYAATVLATGGWIWVGAVFTAYLFRVPRSWRALVQLLPSLVGATWIVEYPIKSAFRRRRPFIEVVRALVIGKKPGSFSFPSGHTASSFASAWVLGTVWPRGRPLFYSLAASIGFSRIYVGAHYPGDVTAGALFGTVLAELFRLIVSRVLRRLT